MNYGNVIYRENTGAYIIKDGTFCVPNPSDETVPEKIREEFKKTWLEIDSYAKENPEKVTIEKPYEPTEEEKAAEELAQAKAGRAEAVSKITVEVDGMKFDGDETAQTRMGRTIAAAVALGVDINTYTQTWVLADNTVATPTIKQLAQVLKLAGDAQTRLWTVPYDEQKTEDLGLAKVGM